MPFPKSDGMAPHELASVAADRAVDEERARECVDIVFDGPPGPVAGRFVEVEDMRGHSVCVGEWKEREDGYWVLRLVVYGVSR